MGSFIAELMQPVPSANDVSRLAPANHKQRPAIRPQSNESVDSVREVIQRQRAAANFEERNHGSLNSQEFRSFKLNSCESSYFNQTRRSRDQSSRLAPRDETHHAERDDYYLKHAHGARM